jgi:hypothetical protein
MNLVAFAVISMVMLALQAPPLDTLSGSIDLQRNALNGQVSLGRGSVSLGARLTEAGPEGQFSFGVPALFSIAMSTGNGVVQSTVCGVVGPQEITLSAGQGSGARVDFHNAADDPTACTPATTGLTMAPNVDAFQAGPPPDAESVQQDGPELGRRLVVLGLTAGLLFLFAPRISAPLTVTARRAPWSRLGLGLCATIALPVTGVLIFVFGLTLGLWWLGLLVLVGFVSLLLLSMTMTGLVLGAWLRQMLPHARMPEAVFFAVGLLGLILLGLLPWIGALINVAALIYGAGVLLLLPRTRQPELAVTTVILPEQPLPVAPAVVAPAAETPAPADGEVVGPRAA